MILYDLMVDGYHTPLTATQIEELYGAGRLRRNDQCKQISTERWRTIDELFPLLKHASVDLAARSGSPVLSRSDYACEERPAMTSALKAGWICFGLGLAISWFFPLGNLFFSVALVTAIVAMCTHQVNRGITLLISSFCAIILCCVVFFGLLVGTVAVAGAAAADKFNRDLSKARASRQQSLHQITAANQQLQAQFKNMTTATTVDTSPALPTLATRPQPPQAPTYYARSAPQVQPMKATADAVRQAEMQRDRINAKEAKLAQIQRSIDILDKLIQQAGGSSEPGNSYFVKQREELADEKWNLSH